MTHWKTEISEINGINIHYTRTGGEKPPLLLLHGLMTNGDCWTAIARELEDKYDVIMPDARGHGKSSAPDFGYTYQDQANDALGLIKFLNLSSLILMGHSMGGMTAALVASQHSKLLRGLILADPTFLTPTIQHEVYESDVAEQHRQIINKSLDELVKTAQIKQPHRSLEILELLAKARLQTSMHAFDVLTPPNPDYMKLITTIDAPSLIVIGDKSSVVSWDVARELQSLNSKFSVEQIQNAGHGLHYDQPEHFARIVKIFLNQLGLV